MGFIFSVDSGRSFSVLFLVYAGSPQVELPRLAKSVFFLPLSVFPFFSDSFLEAILLALSATIPLLLMVKGTEYKQCSEGFRIFFSPGIFKFFVLLCFLVQALTEVHEGQ